MFRALVALAGLAVALADEFQMPYSELWHTPGHDDMDNGFKCTDSEVRKLMRYANEHAEDAANSECGGQMIAGDSSGNSASFEFWDGSKRGQCSDFVLSVYCHSTVFERDNPSKFIYDYPNVELCCAQLGADANTAFPVRPFPNWVNGGDASKYEISPRRRSGGRRGLDTPESTASASKAASHWKHPSWTGLAAAKAKYAKRRLEKLGSDDSDGSDPYHPSDYDFSDDRAKLDCNNYYAVRDAFLEVFDTAPMGAGFCDRDALINSDGPCAECAAGDCRFLPVYPLPDPSNEGDPSFENLCGFGVYERADYAWTLAMVSKNGAMKCCKDNFEAQFDKLPFWEWY